MSAIVSRWCWQKKLSLIKGATLSRSPMPRPALLNMDAADTGELFAGIHEGN